MVPWCFQLVCSGLPVGLSYLLYHGYYQGTIRYQSYQISTFTWLEEEPTTISLKIRGAKLTLTPREQKNSHALA